MKKYTRILLAVLMMVVSMNARTMIVNEINSPKTIDNIRICALRVEFPEDDDELTSGNGKFLYVAETEDTLCSKFKIDPVPHNRAYFQDHIKSLANFYHHASNGHLTIDVENSEVYPLNDDDTYTVSQKLGYYNPFLEEDSVDIRLAELFVEAVQLADDDINFSDYDVVVVFHAGVGQDFSFDLDPTPYDIPSAYMNQADLQKALASGTDGVVVDNGNVTITEGIILPESQNHILYEDWEDVFSTDEPFDYQIALNGTFAFQFGFFLGIPAMFDTESGDAGIGRWGMMDQGSVNLNGLVPPIPNAWVREYMGWIDPVETKSKTDVQLTHAESESDTLAWKVQIDDDEYFLIENRNNFLRPFWNLDSIRNNKYEELDDDADFPSVLPLVKDSIDAEFSEETGVLLAVPRYDLGLPGSGLLIYHIDETVIANNISTNSINNDQERRGVSIEEADGAEDIGFPVQNVFADYNNGWGYDAWFNNNEGFWDINQYNFTDNNETFIAFTDDTYPNTRTNDNVYSGIKIDSIGAAGETMHFVIDFESEMGNFPTDISGVTDETKFSFSDIDDDGNDEIVVVSDEVYLYNSKGTLLNQFNFNDNDLEVNEIEILLKSNNLFIVYQADSKLHYKKINISADAVFSANSSKEIACDEILSNLLVINDHVFSSIKSGDKYSIVDLEDENTIEINDQINKMTSDGNKIYILTDNGQFGSVELDLSTESYEYTTLTGTFYGGESMSIALGNIDDNDDLDAVVSSNTNLIVVRNLSDSEPEINQIECPGITNLVITDINGDGSNDIIVAGYEKIYAYDENLLLLQNFPVEIPNIFSDKSFGKNLLTANVDGKESTREILAFVEDGGLIAIDYRGEMVTDFPKATINPANRLEGVYNCEGAVYFLSINDNQMNSIYLADYTLDEQHWNTPDFNSFYYSYQPSENSDDDDSLLNKKKTFCWPNPATDTYSYIRYYVTEDCDISINIFDISGNFVKTFKNSSPNVSNFNEVAWDVSDMQSGVYYAFVKAEKGSKSETKTVKIMVIK